MSNKNEKNSPISFTKEERINLINDMKRSGYLFPTNDEEWEEFEKVYGTTKSMFPEKFTSPDFLFKKDNLCIFIENG